MSDTGSPLDDHERDQGSVLPSSSHHASRSSTPGLTSLDGTPRHLLSSLSLPRLRSASLPPPDMDMAVKLAYHLAPTWESRCDVVNFAQAPAKMDLPVTSSRPQHLPETSSPSAAQDVPTELNTNQVTSVGDIIRLLRLQKDHRRRCQRAEDSLYRLQIAAARTNRLACAAQSVQHTLAECIKSEDKASFANLLHAFHDASEGCLVQQPEITVEDDGASQSPPASFMDSISTSSKTSILELLTKIRYDGNFLADRLESLSQKELVDLVPDHGRSRQSDSVFGSSVRWSSRASKPLGFVVDSHVDMVSSYSNGSALDTLISSTWALHTSGHFEHTRVTDIWSTVCARLISRQRPGSEKLVPAVLDIWTHSLPWPARERLEIWMQRTLQEGSFLLDQPSKQTFRARVEGRPEIEDAIRAETFYTQAVDSLLGLLGEQSGTSLIPPGALNMSRALWEKLADSPGHQHGLPQFIITRWLCSSFLPDVLTLPEAHDSLTDHYVPETSRQRILRDIATRTQKAVYEVAYPWKHGNKVSSEMYQRVNAIMQLLRGASSRNEKRKPETSHGGSRGSQAEYESFVAVSVKDVIISINALYPQRRPTSVSSDHGSTKSGLQSSASSISGFSLFRSAPSTDTDPRSDVCGSWTPDIHSPVVSTDLQDDFNLAAAQSQHDACLELEDFAAQDASENWAVLAVAPHTAKLCTMRERFSQLGSTDCVRSDSSAPSSDQQHRAHGSSLNAVRLLLGNLEGTNSGDAVLTTTNEEHVSHAWKQLQDLFRTALAECESSSDFVGAHFWHQHFLELHQQVAEQKDMPELKSILQELQETAETSIYRAILIHSACEKWSRLLHSISQLRSDKLGPLADAHERLRDKMWYAADVRTSAAYDEARSIAAALRIMGRPKRLSRARVAPPLRHWSGSKLASTSLQLKSEAQILELLSARPEHGGPNKLSDEQSKATAAWLERENIDNLCKGEERLHRFCMEVRKCVDTIVNSPAESSTISSNVLFARNIPSWRDSSAPSNASSLTGLFNAGGQARLLALQPHLRSSDALSGSSRALSSVGSRDYLDNRSPTLTSKSSMPFWSPAMTEADSPLSTTSMDTSLRQSAMESFQHKQGASPPVTQRSVLDRLRERLTGLLLSDLTLNLYNEGSETDFAFWTGLGLSLVNKQVRNMHMYHMTVGESTPTLPSQISAPPTMARFGFENAFSRLLQKFSTVCSPFTKLSCLYDIDRLLVPYMAQQDTVGHRTAVQSSKETSGEVSVRGFRLLFSQASLRPSTIFRDMQYIAALLPASTLQDTAHGKAFCNAAVAIAGLKRDVRVLMVETADSIIAYHSNNRGHGRSSSSAQQQRDSAIFTTPSRTSSAEDIARYSMADAAYLLQITAKEGDHVAQRELATLYLTHPELMDRIITPFARPKEVFREELEGRWKKNQDLNRCDPTTMCVAHHWMSLSSKGGDSLAKEYLRQREEMDSF